MYNLYNENHSAFTSNESLSSNHFKSDRNSFLLTDNHVSKFSSSSLSSPIYRSKKLTHQSYSKIGFPNTSQNKSKLPCYSDHVLNHDVTSGRSSTKLRKCASASFNTGLMVNLKNIEKEDIPASRRREMKNMKNLQKASTSCWSSEGARENYSLSLSSSNSSFFDDNLAVINRSKSTSSDTTRHSIIKNISVHRSPVSSRPQSLYVPFIGRIETQSQPPGKQARDILMALSYPPIQDDNEYCHSQVASKYPVLSCQSSPIPPLSPFVNAKRSHLPLGDVTYDIENNVSEENKHSSSTGSFTPPLYSPTHPLNHSENTVIRVSHPPVVYPPLGIMQSNLKVKCPLPQMKSPTCERRKSYGSTSMSNCSTISQNSHSSSSGQQTSSEVSKSLSSFGSFSSSSIASSHNHHCNEAITLPLNHNSSNYCLDSNGSNPQNSPSQANKNKHYYQTDHSRLESIRETSPSSNNCRH